MRLRKFNNIGSAMKTRDAGSGTEVSFGKIVSLVKGQIELFNLHYSTIFANLPAATRS
jgi:hypothetical protein